MTNPAQTDRSEVWQLIHAMAALSGAELEDFGVRVASMAAGVTLRHRGVGLKGNPQGHTIDAYSDDGVVGAQFGTEAGYFDSLNKPKADLAQIRKQVPSVTRVYLMSSRTATAARQLELVAWEIESAAQGITLHVFDAARVAEFILNTVMEQEAAFESIVDFLEPLRYLRDLRPASHRLPPLAEGFVAREDVVRDFITRLDIHRVGLLWGMSGIGKSQLAIAVANDPWRAFDSKVWARNTPLQSAADLQAVDVTGRGIRHNLLGMIRSRSCLVILDDPQLDLPLDLLLEQVRDKCGDEARVIVTSQRGSDAPYSVHVPFMDTTEARRVLERGAAPCPDDAFHTIQQAVGGHPMALRLLNALYRPGRSWYDVAEEAHRIGNLADDERSIRLADRVIADRRAVLQEPLAFFQWCRSPRLHSGLLQAVAGLQAIDRLPSLGLASTDQPDTIRLHDIVWTSLSELDPPLVASERDFEAKVDSYVRRLARHESGSLAANHLARVHQALFARLVFGDRPRDGHLYAWLHHRGPGEEMARRLPDALAFAKRVAAGEGDHFTVQTAVELAEATVKVSTTKDATPDVAHLLAPFDEMLASDQVDKLARVRVRHHRAKALKRLRRPIEAIHELEAIVGELGEEATPATVRLLLARTLAELKPHDEIDPGERPREMLHRLLDDAREHPGNVSDSVILAIAELLRWRSVEAGQFLNQFGDLFEEKIVSASQRGLEQGALAFAGVAAKWRDTDPARFWRIFGSLPLPAASDLHDRSEIEAWGEILSNAADHDAADREELLNHSLAFFSRSPSRYARTHRADVLRRLNRAAEAQSVLKALLQESPPPRDRAWALFRLGETHAMLGNTAEVQSCCTEAMAQVEPGSRDWKHFRTWLDAQPGTQVD
ncbi:tetratricopeptide repeat protein [Longimicrobium terrae]|uniref:Tetratricopeptide (TPR) repeat protein n=1 Tax=Longimicrobium terrae TaxID=1639882 RepID=A0A841GWS1_9BACT|nr:hypothetical protein [Longimicrobium terrae]MBB4635998.1 tetratricopeptide (TPR) repeat protein [Longimicrobium terrae]MBB6070394.1 tetratricopeptide (TPR) repeat protein [Longimicrobium terrae]NNC30888.1 hypothetical protein [Longimicrobium terrae]